MKKLEVLLGAALLVAAPEAVAETVRRALVIAHNGSDDPALAPLRYADDDGVLWAETLKRLGVETTLLVDPDEPTRKGGSLVLKPAPAPTRAAVEQAVKRLQRGGARGPRGGTADGRAHRLRGPRQHGRRGPRLLHARRRAPGPDQPLLGGRGSAGRGLRARHRGRVPRLGRGGQPWRDAGRGGAGGAARGARARAAGAAAHVGALFAESDDGETHEWSRIRAGVFSHVARSGLMGGADINGDGQVEYSELAAFVAASLHGVKGMPARLTVHAFAPTAEPRRPLVGPAPEGPRRHLPRRLRARAHLRGGRGRPAAGGRAALAAAVDALLLPPDATCTGCARRTRRRASRWRSCPRARPTCARASCRSAVPPRRRSAAACSPCRWTGPSTTSTSPPRAWCRWTSAALPPPAGGARSAPAVAAPSVGRRAWSWAWARARRWALAHLRHRAQPVVAHAVSRPSLLRRARGLRRDAARRATASACTASRWRGWWALQARAARRCSWRLGAGLGRAGLTAPGFAQADPAHAHHARGRGCDGAVAGMRLRLSARWAWTASPPTARPEWIRSTAWKSP